MSECGGTSSNDADYDFNLAIHTPPDITLLTNFGEDDDNDDNESKSSRCSSGEKQQMRIDYGANYTQNNSNEELLSSEPNVREVDNATTTPDCFSEAVSDQNKCNQGEQFSPSGYDVWTSPRQNMGSASDIQGGFAGNFTAGINTVYNSGPSDNCYQPYPQNMSTTGRTYGVTDPNIRQNPHLNDPSSWMQTQFPATDRLNNNNIINQSSYHMHGYMQNTNSIKLAKSNHLDANDGNWSNNLQSMNLPGENQVESVRSYVKTTSANCSLNRFQVDEQQQPPPPYGHNNLPSYNTSGAPTVNNSGGEGLCGLVYALNNPWQFLNMNTNYAPNSLADQDHQSTSLNMGTYAYPPNIAPPRSSVFANNRSSSNFYPVQPPVHIRQPGNFNPYQPTDVPSPAQLPVYFPFTYPYNNQSPHVYNNNSRFNRPHFTESCPEVNIDTKVVEMSVKHVQSTRQSSHFVDNNGTFSGNHQMVPVTSASCYHAVAGSSCSVCVRAPPASPQAAPYRRGTGGQITSMVPEPDCSICSSFVQPNSQFSELSKSNPVTLPPFRENFGVRAEEAMSKRLKQKAASYVTVRELLLSRRNDDRAVTSAGQTQIPGGSGQVTMSASSNRRNDIFKTTSAGGAATILTKSISAPISSFIETKRKRNVNKLSSDSSALSRKRSLRTYRRLSPKIDESSSARHPMSYERKSVVMLISPKKIQPPSILQSRLMGLSTEECQSTEDSGSKSTVRDETFDELTIISNTTSVDSGENSSSMSPVSPRDKREYRPPRHYDLLSLKIGAFRVLQPVSSPSMNKLKIYFIKRSFVYEFDITDLEREETLASIEIPFSIITAIHCEDREVLISVAAPPKLYLGFKQKRSGAVKSVSQFDREHPTDITNGQLRTQKIHQLYLKNHQADSLRTHLLTFESLFRELLETPVCLDNDEEGASKIEIKVKCPQIDCSDEFEEHQRKSTTVTSCLCHCQVSCRTNRCSCMKSKSECGLSESGCLCRNCDNPLNILGDEGIQVKTAIMDPCLVQKIVNYKGNLMDLLNSELVIDCCGRKTKVKYCIPGLVTCDNDSCVRKASYKYSWCQHQLFYNDITPRNHCTACKTCKDPIDLHCQICRKCNPIGGNGAKCTFCGNQRDTVTTENDVATALMRYRNGPLAHDPSLRYQAAQKAAAGCRVETLIASLTGAVEENGAVKPE